MSDINIVAVDERDSGWERFRPRFRVYLHCSGATSTYGSTGTFDLTGANVLQVIDWAQRQAGDVYTYSIALVVDDPDEERLQPGQGRGLVWLVGMDGNDVTQEPEEVAAQQGMLARPGAPVVVLPQDTMPLTVRDAYRRRNKPALRT